MGDPPAASDAERRRLKERGPLELKYGTPQKGKVAWRTSIWFRLFVFSLLVLKGIDFTTGHFCYLYFFQGTKKQIEEDQAGNVGILLSPWNPSYPFKPFLAWEGSLTEIENRKRVPLFQALYWRT